MRNFGTTLLAAIGIMTSPVGASSDPFTDWRETISPHFHVLHQASFAPPGFTLSLEKLHNRLRMDMAMFSPWMAKERVTLYLYFSRKSYLAGQFKPPLWSNGLAYYDRKILVVPDQPDHKKLMAVIGHEMTHLLFESFWGEAHQPLRALWREGTVQRRRASHQPPHWLNEGLAMLEETERSEDGRQAQWQQAMSLLPADQLIPLSQLFEMVPTETTDPTQVSLWYIQSYSVVYFMYRKHSRLQFFNFCRELSDGRALESALWRVYRYQGLSRFESAWKEWLKPSVTAVVPGSRPTISRTRPRMVGFSDFTFHSFKEGNSSN